MLMIRLQRVGRKNEPSFRIVVTEKQNGPKSGTALEVVGSYDSRHGDKAQFDADRIKYWISKGAKPSGTIHNLLVSKKIIEGKKINVLPKKKPIVKEKAPTAASGEAAPAPTLAPSEVEVPTPEDVGKAPATIIQETKPAEETPKA